MDDREPGSFVREGLAFERLLADLSARFVSLAPCEVDQEIEQGLRLIVQALDVDRSSLMEFSEDGSELTFTHQWARQSIRTDVHRGVRKLVTEETPWYLGKLLQGETLAFSRLPEELPDEASAEKAYCTAMGLRANLTIPLKLSGRPIAALAVGCFQRERQWPPELIPRLRLLGEVFLNAVARRNHAVSLEGALAEIRGLKAQLEEENLYLRKEIDVATRVGGGIVGESAAIKKALVQAEQVAPTDAAVLLLGETGTGKELIARTIHTLSTRRSRTMVRLNCAALPPTLIEERALRPRAGRVHGRAGGRRARSSAARRRHALPGRDRRAAARAAGQAPARAPGAGVRAAGQPQTIPVDVRLIAATNRDLARWPRGQLPGGSLLPPERLPDHHAAATGASRRRPAAGMGVRSRVRHGAGQDLRADPQAHDGSAAALPLAR